jgi:serine/threonine protein kinase
MGLTAQNVCGLLVRSRLFPAADAKALLQRWLVEGGDPPAHGEQFAQWLVARQHLTEFQAQLLARGHTDSFFLNQYKILDRIGKGKMAGVYRAVHSSGQVVAIKVLPPSKSKDPQLLARFQREARLSLRLRHPNVVRTFQTGVANSLHYLVMEYLVGDTLDEVLQRRGRLPPAEAVRLVYKALLGLQHMHEQGLVHRDLKPANLMLIPATALADTTLRATVKILDIGLGRALLDEAKGDKAVDHGLTGEGVLLGTPDYMAPEQARDARTADIRADIYSLGCVLYHALTGQPPFPDTNLINQMVRHATEEARSLRELNPAIPEGLQQIVNWMLAKDPAQRYPTPERAALALKVFLTAGADAPETVEAEPQMQAFLKSLATEEAAGTIEDLPPSPADASPDATAEYTPPAQESPADSDKAAKPKAEVSSGSANRSARSRPRKPKADRTNVEAETEVGRAEAIDVELLPTPPASAGAAPAAFHLTRRDLVMLGIGAGGVLGAIFLGWATARIFRHKDHEGTAPEPQPGEATPDTAP